MTPEEARAFSLTVTALRDLGETMGRLVEALARTLNTAQGVLERADALLKQHQQP